MPTLHLFPHKLILIETKSVWVVVVLISGGETVTDCFSFAEFPCATEYYTRIPVKPPFAHQHSAVHPGRLTLINS